MGSKLKNFLWLLIISSKQILKIDILRFLVCYTRFLYFYKIRSQFRTYYPEDYKSEKLPGSSKEGCGTVEYNASYTKEKNFFEIFNQFSGYRSQRLVGAVATCFSGAEGFRGLQCLSIGPRTEAEIFSWMSFGAKKKDIKTIDLQTYSPWIAPADIVDMPFSDNAFDCIVAGWVFPYVVEKQKAAKEIMRVAKDGALIAVSHSWYSKGDRFSNGDFTNGQVVLTTDEVLCYFKDYIQCVIVNFDQSKIDDTKTGDLITVFKVKKSG